MAITIDQEPDAFSPAYNPLIFVATSDNTGEDNFQYVFDIYWAGVLQTRHRMPANPTSGKAVFNAARIIEAQVTHDIDSSTTEFGVNENSYIEFQVKVGEQYDVAGVATIFADLDTSSFIYAYNGIFDNLDFPSYTSTPYLLSSSSKVFLTNAPSTQKVATGDLLWLHSMTSTTSNYDKLQVKKYDSAGVLLSTDTIANPYTADTDDNRFLRVGVGPANILSSLGGTYLDGVSYYTVQAINAASAAMSELRRFNLDSECSRFTPIRLQFLNKLGGFDAFSFNLVNKDTSEIKREKYKRKTGTLSGSTFSYSQTDRSEHTLSTVIDASKNITSDWLSEAESLWLEELVTSPVVFQELSGVLIPITITDTRYEPQKKANKRVFNLSISFNYSIANYRQRY